MIKLIKPAMRVPNYLSPEHGARGNLHVVIEFQISSKSQALGPGKITKGLEGDVGDGATRDGATRENV